MSACATEPRRADVVTDGHGIGALHPPGRGHQGLPQRAQGAPGDLATPASTSCLANWWRWSGPRAAASRTLLKILAGLHTHDGGTVRIGSATHPFDPARDIGMVFQAPLLLKWRRILDNVLLPAEICWACRWRRRASVRAS